MGLIVVLSLQPSLRISPRASDTARLLRSGRFASYDCCDLEPYPCTPVTRCRDVAQNQLVAVD